MSFGASADELRSIKPIDFAADIRPILTEKCVGCHGGDQPKGHLKLNEREAVIGKGESGSFAVVPGNPESSELFRRITTDNADERMPPHDEKQLTAQEIALLKRWIAEGAKWSGHWAFQPIVASAVPTVSKPEWVRNQIDQFILHRLDQQGMTPAVEADRYTLIKRLHYDLTGLPPSIEQVDAFVADTSPNAYELLVERLLESPHYGERWGRHWLDLAHFADSDGYEKDRARPDAHIYRDWVIDAINKDLPFDKFTIEQLAGDLLPDRTQQQKVATGFLRQTLTNEEGGVDQEEYRIAACFDRTETVGTVWLGLTVGCVRCHDHKFDPLTHTEYYQLFAFFNNSEEITSSLTVSADDPDELQQQLRPLEDSLAARYVELAAAELAWETTERDRVMSRPEGGAKEQRVEIVSVSGQSTPNTSFKVEGDDLFVEPVATPASETATTAGSMPDKDVYTVTVKLPKADITGFKLLALPDKRLPEGGSGLAADGSFVLTRFQAFIVDLDGRSTPIELHRVTADYTQKGFNAEQVLTDDPVGSSTGWSIAGKATEKHSIQFRTREPLSLSDGTIIRIVLDQQHGDRHQLGRFRIAALTGGERGLYLSDDKIASALEMYPEKRVASIKQQLFNYYVTNVAVDETVLSLRRQIATLQKMHNAKLTDVRTIGTPRLSRTTHVFHRGEFLSPKQVVEPTVPAVLSELKTRGRQADRLDFARWLVSPQNDLAPRVAVNHAWQHLFGFGIVRTPNDFGTRGEPPTHPELLDWLASTFRTDLAWSRKDLIRLIVNSATYRQSSSHRPDVEKRDPLNQLLFRQNRSRVESEVVRDLSLSVSGLLSSKVGGPSTFPPMPEDLAKLSYANSFAWNISEGESRFRRGMYTFFKRTIPHPNLMTFDSPDANVACCVRTVSNTPLQALTLLNNEVHTEASQAMAVRLLQEKPISTSEVANDLQKLTLAIRLCVARPPTAAELNSLVKVLHASRTYYGEHPEEAGQMIHLHKSQQVPAAEAAAWVSTVRVVLNLDEFLTRE